MHIAADEARACVDAGPLDYCLQGPTGLQRKKGAERGDQHENEAFVSQRCPSHLTDRGGQHSTSGRMSVRTTVVHHDSAWLRRSPCRRLRAYDEGIRPVAGRTSPHDQDGLKATGTAMRRGLVSDVAEMAVVAADLLFRDRRPSTTRIVRAAKSRGARNDLKVAIWAASKSLTSSSFLERDRSFRRCIVDPSRPALSLPSTPIRYRDPEICPLLFLQDSRC
jgi:hypothetical protein